MDARFLSRDPYFERLWKITVIALDRARCHRMRIRPAAARHPQVLACGIFPRYSFGALPKWTPKYKGRLSLFCLSASWLPAPVAALDFANFAPTNTPGCLFAAAALVPPVTPGEPRLPEAAFWESGRLRLVFGEDSGDAAQCRAAR